MRTAMPTLAAWGRSGGHDTARPNRAPERWAGCFALIALLAGPVFASEALVDSFVQAPTATQVVPHRLGLVPVALIMWTSGQPDAGVSGAGSGFSIGISDGVRDYVVSSTITDNSPAITSSRTIAPVLVTIDTTAGVPRARATLTNWSSTDLTLSWSANDGVPRRISYLLLGGNDVQARALDYLTRTTMGPQVVTGVGFQPDLLINLFAATANTALPSSVAASHPHLSVASLTAGWTIGFNAQGTLSNRYTSGLPYFVTQTSAATPQLAATLMATGPDGFTVDLGVPAAVRIMTLALKGPGLAAGLRSRGPVDAGTAQAVTGLGFSPGAVLLASTFGQGAQPLTDAQWCIGAGDGVREVSSAFRDRSGAVPTSVSSREAVTVLVQAAGGTDEAARLASFNSDGFGVTWLRQSTGTLEFGFLALGLRAPADGGSGTADAGGGVDAGAQPDAGVDAGAGADAGARAESDAGVDAGAGADAGARAESDAGVDAGADADAGAQAESDAGRETGADAGAADGGAATNDDGAHDPRALRVGCGCAASEPWGVMALLGCFARRLKRARQRKYTSSISTSSPTGMAPPDEKT
jgi:hypothetical protein